MTHILPDTKDMALAIAENSVHGIVVMDQDGYCLYANRAWQEMTGYSIAEMRDRPVHDCVHHHRPDGSPFPIGECPIGCTLGKNQNVRNHHDLFFRKDGSPFDVSCAASPIVAAGKPTLMILEIRDISEEKQADRRREDFLAMLAHELRNPLAPISAAADLLRMQNLDGERVRRASAVIARQVEHMTGLVDDLLDVSRVTRGLITLERARVDLKTAVLNAVEQVRPLIEARHHRLAIHAPPDQAFTLGDGNRLVQVVANLLNNAAKYTPEGGQLELSLAVADGMVRIGVADNGIGMTPDMAARAFELFSQAQRTPDRTQGGLGIGLALVRSLVAMHGGEVTAHSDGPGKGSRFTVSLPCQGAGHAEAGAATAVAPATAATAAMAARPLNIMVVDDSHDTGQMLAELLQALGHAVRVEQDPRRALESAHASAADVFFLDIGLPHIEGGELARRLRQQANNANAMLVAVTGYGQAHDRRAAADAGFDHHLVKPASLQRLMGILQDAAAMPALAAAAAPGASPTAS